MTDSSKEPSKGAMRAARVLRCKIHNLDGRGGEGTDPNHEANVRWLAHVTPEDAALIDRETKAGEMAALLKAIVESCVNDSDSCCICVQQVDGDHRHSEGCVILLAERLLTDLEVKP